MKNILKIYATIDRYFYSYRQNTVAECTCAVAVAA